MNTAKSSSTRGKSADAVNRRLINSLARRIRTAAERRIPCSPITQDLSEHDFASAYAIQRLNIAHWIRQGHRIIGHKIGVARKADQRHLGLDAPISGTLFADMLIDNDEEISAGRVMSPKAEAEIALVLERSLTMMPVTVIDVMRACAFVLPALEITGSRFPLGSASVVDEIADNCGSGLFAVGTPPRELTDAPLGQVRLIIERDGRRSVAIDTMSSISTALAVTAWLGTRLNLERSPLTAGSVVITGAIGGDVAISAGDRIEAVFDSFDPITVTLAAEQGS